MSRQSQNSGFICDHCCQQVIPVTNGSYRNHCPFCLYSKHLDYVPGDRGSACGGLMEPMGLTYKSGKGFQIVHRCLKCSIKRLNKVAENTIQPDDIEALVDLSQV